MALSRAPQTREIGTFSWEAGNLVVTKAPFCNEVLRKKLKSPLHKVDITHFFLFYYTLKDVLPSCLTRFYLCNLRVILIADST